MERFTDDRELEGAGVGDNILSATHDPPHVSDPRAFGLTLGHLKHLRFEVDSPDLAKPAGERQGEPPRPTSKIK